MAETLTYWGVEGIDDPLALVPCDGCGRWVGCACEEAE